MCVYVCVHVCVSECVCVCVCVCVCPKAHLMFADVVETHCNIYKLTKD